MFTSCVILGLLFWATLYEAASFPIDFGDRILPILELSSVAVLAMDCGKDAFEEDFSSDLILLKILEIPLIKEPSSLLCEDLFDVR